ncbi:protein sax-3-like [Strongylocentrotus purpuratus]|uniref:Ig-like domain-containing protein n=1 Tax=Strongylocentrotus purpuratus TaxID=7668 RepID=A0A7M7NYQ1_STRPU|nr:protein sax-3-like [Strongylocentrotus purpuratus]
MRYRECVIDSCLGDDVDSEDCSADELCEDSTAISEFKAEEGKGVVISCLDSRFVEDHPGSEVVWSKNEEPVKMDDRFVLVDLADLEIKRVQPDDEGVYVCSVLSGDKTFNRHVVLLKIHSKSGGGGGGKFLCQY